MDPSLLAAISVELGIIAYVKRKAISRIIVDKAMDYVHFLPIKPDPVWIVIPKEELCEYPKFLLPHVLGAYRKLRTIELIHLKVTESSVDYVTVTLSHEYLHHWLRWNVSEKACLEFDERFLQELLEEYGV